MAQRHIRMELYSIHAHLPSNFPVDYPSLFGSLDKLAGQYPEGNRRIAIQAVSLEGRLSIVAYTGFSTNSLMYFDLRQYAEVIESNSADRFPARKTHALIEPKKRLLLIETRKGGLRPFDLATIIEAEAHKDPRFEGLEIVFTPVADSQFIKEIDQLKRIQSASVTIARPNVDWTDRHSQLTEFADDSDAKSLDVTARAKRGKGLAREAGVIGLVKAFVAQPLSSFKKIRIIGERDGGLITLNLSKHIEQLNVSLQTDPNTGQVKDNEVRGRMSAYLDGRE